MPLKNAALRSDLLLVVVTLLAAAGWIFSREAVLAMPPLLFMAIRFLLAASLLACIAHRQLAKLTAADVKRAMRVGLVFGIAMSLWVSGLAKSSHVGEAAFIASLGIILVPVIGRIFFREPIPLNTWLAMPWAIAGLACLSLSKQLQFETAHLLLLGSAAIFALYFNLNTRAANDQTTESRDGAPHQSARIPVLALTTLVLATVGLVTGTLSALLEEWRPTLTAFEPLLILWITLSALISTALRFLVQTYAQSLTRHSNGVVIMILEPVWTAMIAALWFGEDMTTIQLLGCGLIFMSLLINRMKALLSLIRHRKPGI